MDVCRENYRGNVLFFTKHFKSVFQRDLVKRQKWFRKKWYSVILECLHVLYCCTHYIYLVEYLLHRRTNDFSVFEPDISPFAFFLTIDVGFNTLYLQLFEYCFPQRANRICNGHSVSKKNCFYVTCSLDTPHKR